MASHVLSLADLRAGAPGRLARLDMKLNASGAPAADGMHFSQASQLRGSKRGDLG